MRGKWLLIAGVLLIGGIGAGVISHRARKAAPPAPAASAALVRTNELAIPGTVRAQHVVGVGAEIEGNIEAFAVDAGDEVFEGQVLARIGSAGLENTREQAQSAVDAAQQQVGTAEAALASARLESSRADADFQRAKSQLDRAQKTFDRQNMLFQRGATPKLKYEASLQEFEAAAKDFDIMDKAARGAKDAAQTAASQLSKAKLALAEKGQELEAAEGAFAAAELRAPVAGTVVGRKGEPGKPAREFGNDLFQIATDLFALEVVAQPKPDELKRIHPGQDVLVLLPDMGSAGMPGRVREIKEADVIVEFNSSVPAIKPGSRAELRFRFD